MQFHSSPNPTIGLEIELQLVDDNTLDLKNISPRVLADMDKNFSNRIKCELFESMIEINTVFAALLKKLVKTIRQTLTHLEEILKNYDASINCSSLHPFAKGKNQIVSNNPRYKRIMKDLQIVGTRFITQGLHVHIGIDDCEKAIKVNNALRMYLPLLLLLLLHRPILKEKIQAFIPIEQKFLNLYP